MADQMRLPEDEGSRGASSRRSVSDRRGSGRMEAVFPLLSLFEAPLSVAHWRYVILGGVLIDIVQQLAFVVNPHFLYDITIPKEVTYLLYAFHIPIWDSKISRVSYNQFLAWYWIVAGMVTLISAFIAAVIFHRDHARKKNVLNSFFKVLVHFVENILAVPMLHGLCAHMFCNKKRLWAFPDEKCWTVAATLYFCFSLILLFLLTTICAVVRSCLFEDNPFSRHPLARAHGRLDLFVTAQRFVQVLLFHLLLGPGWKSAYCFFIVVFNAMGFLAFAFVSPYYNQQITQVRCATYFATFCAACVSFASTYLSPSFTKYYVNTQWLWCMAPVGAIVGYYLGGTRVRRECKERLWHLKQYGEVYRHHCWFPCGIPQNDLVLHGASPLANFEHEILAFGQKQREEQEQDGEMRREVDVLVPYVSFITMTTDVELSTRFLREHALITGRVAESASSGSSRAADAQKTPHQMLAFGARIFMKGVIKWKASAVIRLHFAHFILAYCPASKYMGALDQCDEALHGGEFGIRYQAYKLHNRLRGHLGMHDRTHRFALDRARKFHKEALNDMVMFWLKLMDSKSDIMNLAAIANQITDRRDRGLAEYQRAIRDSASQDRMLLLSYAGFLETVMFDPKQADFVRQRANDLGEEMRRGMIGSSKQVSETSTAASENRRLLLQESSSEDASTATSNAAQLLSVAIILTSVLVVLLTIASFLTQFFNTKSQISTIDKVHTSGMVRTLVQMCGHDVWLIEDAIECVSGVTASCPINADAKQDLIYHTQVKLRDRAAALEYNNNRLTYGEYKTNYAPHVDYYREPRIAFTEYHGLGSGHGSHKPNGNVVVVGLWSASQHILSAIHDIAIVVPNGTELLCEGSGECAFKTLRPFRFVLNNVPTKAAWAYNESVTLYEVELDMYSDWILVGLSIALAITLIIILAVNVVLVLNFEKIGVTKIVALHLFSLIPFTVQEQLWASARDRVQDLDRQTKEEVDGREQLDQVMMGEEQEEASESEHDNASSTIGSGLLSTTHTSHSRPGSHHLGESHKKLVSIMKSTRTHATMAKKKRKQKRVRFNLEGLTTGKRTDGVSTRFTEPPPDAATVMPTGELDGSTVGLLTRDERRELLALDDDTGNRAAAEKAAGRQKESSVATTEHQKSDSSGNARVVLMLFVSTLVTLAAVCLLVSVSHKESEVQHSQSRHHEFMNDLTEYDLLGREMREAAQSMSQMGYVNPYWGRYWDMLHAKRLVDLRRSMELQMNKEELIDFAEVERQARVTEHTQKVALAITAAGWDIPVDMQGEVARFTWPESEIDMHEYRNEHLRVCKTDDCEQTRMQMKRTYAYKDSDHDLPRGEQPQSVRDHQIELSRRVLGSDRYRVDIQRLREYIIALRQRVFERLENDADKELDNYTLQVYFDIFLFVIVVLAIAMPWPVPQSDKQTLTQTIRDMKFTGGLGWTIWMRPTLRRPSLFLLLIALVACALLSMLLLVVVKVDITDFRDKHEDLIQATILKNATLATIREHSIKAHLYVSDADGLRYLRYWELVEQGTLANLWRRSDLFAHSINKYGATEEARKTAHSAVELLDHRHLIAFQLVKWAEDKDWGHSLIHQSELKHHYEQDSVTWDITTEPNYLTDLVKYSTDTVSDRYNNSYIDKYNKSAVQQIRIARHTVFSKKYDDLYKDAVDKTNEYFNQLTAGAQRHVDDLEDELGTIRSVALIVSLVSVGLQALFAVLLGTFCLEVDFDHSGVENINRVLFAGLTRRCRLAYLLVVGLFLAQFSVGVVNTRRAGPIASELNAATRREWAVARSSLYSDILFKAWENGKVAEGSKRRVAEMIQELKDTRNTLYFGKAGTNSYRGAGASGGQDDITFGTDDKSGFEQSITPGSGAASAVGGTSENINRLYRQWIDDLQELLEASDRKLALHSDNESITGSPVAVGAAAAQAGVTTSESGIINARNVEAIHEDLKSNLDVLINKLWQSGQYYRDEGKTTIEDDNRTYIIICCVLVFVVIVEYEIVFRPVLIQLTDEENGTKALLRMIPRQVREFVPKIGAYLEHGVIVDEATDVSVFTRCTVVASFIRDAARSDKTMDELYIQLEDSDHAVVVTDDVGNCQYTTAKFPDMFPGYSATEMVNQNVSILLPEALGMYHGQFLENYKTSGQARIVGKGRDVLGIDKDGNPNHLFLNLFECRRGDELYFIAQFDRYLLLEQAIRHDGGVSK